jgi:hypothetical protein
MSRADERYSLGLRQQKFVKWTGIACVFAYAGVLGAIWGHCTPVQRNWQVVPYPGGRRNSYLILSRGDTDDFWQITARMQLQTT